MSSIITLRCAATDLLGSDNVNKTDTGVVLQVPPNCRDGTCDGCLYQFMVLSEQSCPFCNQEEYERIEGSCIGGSRDVRLIAPK